MPRHAALLVFIMIWLIRLAHRRRRDWQYVFASSRIDAIVDSESGDAIKASGLGENLKGGLSWCFQVCRDEVHKDQVPDLPYLNATIWAS